MTSCERAHRSVLDYPFTHDLVKALEGALVISKEENGDTSSSSPQQQRSSSSCIRAGMKNDWILPVFDETTCKPQSVQAETKRLQVLSNFMILETEKERVFDDITANACRTFNVTWALVSLVDLGRQWSKSLADLDEENYPLGFTETARRDAFCSYAIQSKEDIFVVPDASLDVRFCDNPLVAGGPKVRFYAGIPLQVPAGAAADDDEEEEGVRLGTMCVLDNKPHPNGLTATEERDLRDMAARVLQLLVDRRAKLHSEQTERKHERRVIASRNSLDENSSFSSSSSSSSTICLDDVKKSRTGGSPQSSPRIVALQQQEGAPSAVAALASTTASAAATSAASTAVVRNEQAFQDPSRPQQQIRLLPRPMVTTTLILPDYKTAGIDPDMYLSQLVQAMYGVKVQPKAALELQVFFPSITDEQMAAYSMQVVTATRQNELPVLRDIVATQGPDAVNCFNRFGESLLNLACRRGFKDIVSFFVHEVRLSVRTRDDGGRTPLHDACWNAEPQLEICTWLLEQDASLFLIRDKRGYTAFQYARKSDWHIWRKFLYDNRHALQGLARADIVKTFSGSSFLQTPYQTVG